MAILALSCHGLADIIVIDDTGRSVQLAQPAKRIISLAPHTTEMLFAAGAGDKVVGTVSYSDFPPAAKQIPRIGSFEHFDYERIAALQPDLVVGWSSGNPGDAQEQLRRLGFPLYLSEPSSIDAIATNMERLAELTGTQTAAEDNIRRFRSDMRALARKYRDARPVSIFYEVWNDPLMTLNGEHLFNDLATLCGGKNVFAELPALAPRVNIEAVLAKNPEVIIASGANEARPEWLDDWKRWPTLQAVKNNHLYVVPPDIIQRHTPRIAEGAAMLCRHLERARKDYQREDELRSPHDIP